MIHGIIAYPVTPFAADGIDTTRLAALVERFVSSGVHAIAPLGSTGELAYLDEPEFDAVVDATIAIVAGRVPVIVGVSDVTTAKTIRRARYAQRAGADAVMILPVSYWKLTEREITQHYPQHQRRHRHPDHGLQQSGHQRRGHEPGAAGRNVRNHRQRHHGQGVHRRLVQDAAHQRTVRRPSTVLQRQHPLVLDALRAGASGWCTAAPCLRPQPCIDLYEAVRAGDLDTAQARYDELKPLLEFIVAGGLATTVKAGLDLLGFPVGDPRPPLLPLDEPGRAELKELLAVG